MTRDKLLILRDSAIAESRKRHLEDNQRRLGEIVQKKPSLEAWPLTPDHEGIWLVLPDCMGIEVIGVGDPMFEVDGKLFNRIEDAVAFSFDMFSIQRPLSE